MADIARPWQIMLPATKGNGHLELNRWQSANKWSAHLNEPTKLPYIFSNLLPFSHHYSIFFGEFLHIFLPSPPWPRNSPKARSSSEAPIWSAPLPPGCHVAVVGCSTEKGVHCTGHLSARSPKGWIRIGETTICDVKRMQKYLENHEKNLIFK